MTTRSLPDDDGSLSSIVVPTSGSFAVIFAGRTDSGEEENSDGEDFRGIATATHTARHAENEPLSTSSEEDQASFSFSDLRVHLSYLIER